MFLSLYSNVDYEFYVGLFDIYSCNIFIEFMFGGYGIGICLLLMNILIRWILVNFLWLYLLYCFDLFIEWE